MVIIEWYNLLANKFLNFPENKKEATENPNHILKINDGYFTDLFSL